MLMAITAILVGAILGVLALGVSSLFVEPRTF